MMALIVRFNGIIQWMQPNNRGISRKYENMRGQGYDSDAKDDNSSKVLVELKIKKYILLVFYYCPVVINMTVWYFC